MEVSPLSGMIAQEIGSHINKHGGFGLFADYGHDGNKEDTFRVCVLLQVQAGPNIGSQKDVGVLGSTRESGILLSLVPSCKKLELSSLFLFAVNYFKIERHFQYRQETWARQDHVGPKSKRHDIFAYDKIGV